MQKNDPLWAAKISSFIGFLILAISGIILFPSTHVTPIAVIIFLGLIAAYVFLYIFYEDRFEKKYGKNCLSGASFCISMFITTTALLLWFWFFGLLFKWVSPDNGVAILKMVAVAFFLSLIITAASVRRAKKEAKNHRATEYTSEYAGKSILRGKHGDFNLSYKLVCVYELKNSDFPDPHLFIRTVKKMYEILDKLNLDRYTRELLLDSSKKSLSIDPQIFVSGNNPLFYAGRINDLTITKIQ
ncbi:hypothetical protein A2303_06985 [Candidatus Falkowbacteria bacterium RIFOXYB2_FULL_47_14]|uniref:Uncharacterized protein n=1 Tax=Candidatus Falkowbacteria bacterium RIFOXYA2_FULL_47_19 TaxID=1797994 RepID=A0A1F5SG72_9BACT|nr:MAG: hypothetical protein A2227_00730 [Candidatus Falkowbacteria bacterium RIFOXYA2_FULL_47_19]OGF34899.1 MAG: hypothetical protein A2468_06690 [Candidatus Falkowbacteria bacterium RIFOXYC2_FULL_46_15]OGF43614.1 MAG: hypothetical protein A2303_06985 [Candidatus Falkowbacteria bacterium RIFOXYB2_FULL_47_14]